MSILIDASTRILVSGITGATARVDAERSLRYGSHIVCGVSPGKGGTSLHGVPVYDTVQRALAVHEVDAASIYVPPAATRDAVLEALEAGIKLLLVTAEYVPAHDVAYIVHACRASGARLIGCNTNGVISPGQSRLGGIGGENPDEIYAPGTIGICSRSGGMSAEISLALKQGGFGVSTCVSMGGDQITGLSMADYGELFEADPATEAIVVFGEPGTCNEQELAQAVASGRIRKPVLALVMGLFQEAYPAGVSFGHAAAMIDSAQDTASAKRRELAAAGVGVCASLDELPAALSHALELARTAQSKRSQV
jgi:succinyl-CoA synthetase alpha subunit